MLRQAGRRTQEPGRKVGKDAKTGRKKGPRNTELKARKDPGPRKEGRTPDPGKKTGKDATVQFAHLPPATSPAGQGRKGEGLGRGGGKGCP